MRCRHFRIEEYKYHANSRFINGCPERFDFGDSEFVQLSDARHIVESCFKEPYSRAMSEAEVAATFNMAAHTNGVAANGHKGKRNIVLVGHNPAADIDYLAKIGYNVLKLDNLVETIDTASLWRAHKQEAQPTSLGNILYHLDIAGWNLHNAGNDAAYTLQAMLAIVVRDAAQRGKTEALIKKEERERNLLSDRVNEAIELAQDQKKEWSAAVDDAGDGGVPLPLGHGTAPQIQSADGEDDIADPYRRNNRKKSSKGRSMNDRLVHGSRRDFFRSQMYPAEKKFYASEDGYTVTTDPGTRLTHIQDISDGLSPKLQVIAKVDDNNMTQKERTAEEASDDTSLKEQLNGAKIQKERITPENAVGVDSQINHVTAADTDHTKNETDELLVETLTGVNVVAAAAA